MNRFELIDQAVNTVYNWVYNAEQQSAQRTKTVGTDDLKKLLDMLHQIELKMGNFIDDAEKMHDFRIMKKDEFLQSYSYLTEDEYDNTKLIYRARRMPYYKKQLEKAIEENATLEAMLENCHDDV